MINSALYKDPVLLDPVQHRALRMVELTDYSITRGMHAVFLTATEFLQAGLEFPILFVHTGERDAQGKPQISPIVLLGLVQGENLCVDGSTWGARYIPAFIRRFPFLTANLKGAGATGVMIDRAWPGFREDEGLPLFDENGKPALALEGAIKFLEMFETEAQRTRIFCQRIVELDLLKEMKADVTLPDGKLLSVDGFFTLDEEKLRDLAEANVVELHRNGMLLLLNVHLASLANLRHLMDRKARLEAARGGVAPEAPPAAG